MAQVIFDALLAGQDAQVIRTELPSAQNPPAVHAAGKVPKPALVHDLPAGQGLQNKELVAPTDVEKVPTGQRGITEELVPEGQKVPAEQMTGVEIDAPQL